MMPLSNAQLRLVPWPARTLFGATGILVLLGVALAANEPAALNTWIHIASAALYLGVGLLGLVLIAPARRNAAGWVLLGSGVAAALLPVLDMAANRPSSTWGIGIGIGILSSLSASTLIALFTVGVLLFPDGRPHQRLGRVLLPIACLALALLAVGGAGLPATDGAQAPVSGVLADTASILVVAGFALILPLSVLAAVTVTRRRSRAVDDRRRGLLLLESAAWINAAAFLICGGLSVIADLPDWFGTVADQTGVVFAVAAWIALLRFDLMDIRLLIARTLPFLIASLLVFGTAMLVAAFAGNLVTGWLGLGLGAAMSALIALLLRDRLQVLGNLIVYGRRLDPAMEREQRLEQALRDAQRLSVAERDEERRRIRRDLHDGLGPTLAGMMLAAESAERHLDDPFRARADLARLHEASQNAVQEVRRIVYALRPPILDSLGLDGAIREQAERLGATRIDVLSLPALPETLEIGVYLIALEAMNNAAKHARPAAFRVRLAGNSRLSLEVRDDGPGLPHDYAPGIGIDSMRMRAAELGGTFEIASVQPRGTLVRAEWALPV